MSRPRKKKDDRGVGCLKSRSHWDLIIIFSTATLYIQRAVYFSLEVESEVGWSSKTNAGDEKSACKMGVRFLRCDEWGEQSNQRMYPQTPP